LSAFIHCDCMLFVDTRDPIRSPIQPDLLAAFMTTYPMHPAG
jgi:hypothetical protein